MSAREHWKQHACLLPTNNIEGESQNNAGASVYSAKNEGASPYVLLNSSVVGFDFSAKFTPAVARKVAAALVAAADEIDQMAKVVA